MSIKKCILLMMVVAIVMVIMVKEVEALSCMEKCTLLCGLTLQPREVCIRKCKRKCHIKSSISISPDEDYRIGKHKTVDISFNKKKHKMVDTSTKQSIYL